MNDSRLSGIDPAKLQMLFSMSGQGASKSQNELRIREFHFKEYRQKIRELSTVHALPLLRSCILEKETAEK